MSVIHVNQIKAQVSTLFSGKIDVSDIGSNATQEVRDSLFLSRALAAYSIYYLAQADIDDCAKSVVDRGDDNGIDALYYDTREKKFYIVQSKWIHNGRGEPENGDIKKFVAGIKDLFNLSFERFNKLINNKKSIIESALNDPVTTYEVVVAYTGINRLAPPSKRDLDDLLEEMNDASEVLSVSTLNQSDLHNSLTAGISGEPISIDVGIKSWGKTQSPHMAYYGQVNGLQVAEWWSKYRTRLFAKNLRSILGDTEVNDEIRSTIANNPQFFWYFNNGITLVCKKIAKTMVGGGDTDFGTFHCTEISVVNGAQTVGTVGKYGETSRENLEKVFIPIRVISLESGDDKFGESITKTNNRQNRIENRDFVTLDPEQTRIKTELAIERIQYQLMRSEIVQRTSDSFDLVESTTALACASGKINLAVQLKREIGKLWENIEKGPYKELFNASVSGMYVWRCVQVQRIIDAELEALLRVYSGVSGREYGIGIHGNRMIALLVFTRVRASRFRDPSFNFQEIVESNIIRTETAECYKSLKEQVEISFPGAIIPTLFKNLTKCRQLQTAALHKTTSLEL